MKYLRWVFRYRPFRWLLHELSYDLGIAHCEAILCGEEWKYSKPLDRFAETAEKELGSELLTAQRKKYGVEFLKRYGRLAE